VRRSSLERAALRLAAVLGDGQYVLVGGLAVMAHGYVRATEDVDFVARSLPHAAERLREAGVVFERRRGDFSCLKGILDGVPFDVLPALVPIAWESAVPVPFRRGARLWVVDLDGLIRLKLRAAGPQDLMDVAALVLRHPSLRDRARELGVAYKVGEKLEVWLGDARLDAQLQESRRPQPAKRRPRRRS
jgi:hypothetical protein